MRTEVIFADTIYTAAEQILFELKEGHRTTRSPSSRNNVFYFDGWDGLGASAVLRAIARLNLKDKIASFGTNISTGFKFEQIIHVDCSKWKSRRELQRILAKQLNFPPRVMEIFDKQDEEDDFRGVAEGSRIELPQITNFIYQHMQKLNDRFLVIFHNGSNEEINLENFCGVPLSGYSTNKVLWTFQGGFRLKPRTKVDSTLKSAGTTDVFLSASEDTTFRFLPPSGHDLWSYLVHEEAKELVAGLKINTGPRGIIDPPAQVVECFLYLLELCWRGRHSIDYDLANHIANYWICDGIIKQLQPAERDVGADDDDGLWRGAEALQHEMQLDVDYHQYFLPSHLARCAESKAYWTSPTYGLVLILGGSIPNGDMFQNYFKKLSVLKFSRCTFNFSSPPFLCCHNLRFLWIDHCRVLETSTTNGEGTENDDIRQCFQKLWVLDMRYTEGCDLILSAQMMDLMTHLRELNVMGACVWDIGQLQGRLPNICKLRVTKSELQCSCSKNDLLSNKNKMELLQFSENTTFESMISLYGPGVGKSNSSLETVIIDGCFGLKEISFRGCTNLKNILLRGDLGILYTLDISSTVVKTLDLTTTKILFLDELYLLNCKKLCAIMWPPENQRKENISKLRIDTTQSAHPTRCGEQEESSSTGKLLSSTGVLHGNQPVSKFDWHIALRDPRLLVSLEPVYSSSRKTYVEISSTNVAIGASKYERPIESGHRSLMPVISTQQKKQSMCALIYADIAVENLQQGNDESNGYAAGIGWMWPCPDAPHLPKESCYMQIQDQQGTITVPDFVIHHAKILHVKDSLSTILPSSAASGLEWHVLEWCRIERCPELECIFEPGHIRGQSFEYKLKTFWASHLPEAHYIWKWSEPSIVYRKFDDLTYLHLDFCPRLVHILPLGLLMNTSREEGENHSFRCLETLEIMWCGDLREVFPLDCHIKQQPQLQEQKWELQKQLRRHRRQEWLPQPGRLGRQQLRQEWQLEQERQKLLQQLERQLQELERQLQELEQQRLELLRRQQPITLDFPKLKRIHLHELPTLHSLWEHGRISAPELEAVKIRGCWSLKCLPTVQKVVLCECEKEWWDSLQWEVASQKKLYKPIHPKYYKKATLLRGSVLR